MSWFRRKLISRERSNVCCLDLLPFIDFTTIPITPDCVWVRYVIYWIFLNSCSALKITLNLYHVSIRILSSAISMLMADTGIASISAQGLWALPSRSAQ